LSKKVVIYKDIVEHQNLRLLKSKKVA